MGKIPNFTGSRLYPIPRPVAPSNSAMILAVGIDMRAPSHSSAGKTHRHAAHRRSLSAYAPLLILITLAALVAGAKELHYGGGWDSREWMLDAMGFFLVMFSMFKFFDLEGFADGFHMYDLLAQRVRSYGFVYPFIEFTLGLGYLARWELPLIYGVTLGVMSFGALGVLNALRQKLDVNCACMGTVLKVPLSTVALTEDVAMAAMAAVMLVSLR